MIRCVPNASDRASPRMLRRNTLRLMVLKCRWHAAARAGKETSSHGAGPCETTRGSTGTNTSMGGRRMAICGGGGAEDRSRLSHRLEQVPSSGRILMEMPAGRTASGNRHRSTGHRESAWASALDFAGYWDAHLIRHGRYSSAQSNCALCRRTTGASNRALLEAQRLRGLSAVESLDRVDPVDGPYQTDEGSSTIWRAGFKKAGLDAARGVS